MKKLSLAFLLSMSGLFLLSGCANWTPPLSIRGPSVAQLRAEHRYLSALKVLAAQRTQFSNYEAERDVLIAEARARQTDVLREARALQQQTQFAKAQEVFETARVELPQSRELDEFAEQFYAARDRYIQRNFDELIRLRAAPLARQHAAYLALQKAAADPELQKVVDRHLRDVDYFAPLIAKIGVQALEQGEYARAKQYLVIAYQLTPSLQLAQQLKSAEQAIAANTQKKQIARLSEREQRYRDLNFALQQSIDQRDFLAARDQLEQARALGIHTDELDAIQKQLDEVIQTFVALHSDTGDRLYADGRIEDALRHWVQADLLISTPELKEKIEKAQKFIGRLHQLQNARQTPNAKTSNSKNAR